MAHIVRAIFKEFDAAWRPGRCIVPGDIEASCPFSKAGCWVHKAENCPLYREGDNGIQKKGDNGGGGADGGGAAGTDAGGSKGGGV